MKITSHINILAFDGKDAMNSDTQKEYGASHRDTVDISSDPTHLHVVTISVPHKNTPEIRVRISDIRKALDAAEIAHRESYALSQHAAKEAK